MASEADRPFLERLATEIESSQIKNQLVVLPNRRSLFVLKEMLTEADIKLITIDDLMSELSGLQLIEPEELQVSFFNVYSSLEKEPQSFDTFSKWAVTFLGDANDVDLHLGDFETLSKQIDEYHRTGEGFVDQSTGPLEDSFLSFWNRLPVYYKALRDELSKLNLGYRGLLYRSVAEMVSERPSLLERYFGDHMINWVGIVPGNPSERVLLDWLRNRNQLKLFADVDRFYLEKPEHEAGRLFRKDPLGDEMLWKTNSLSTQAKTIKEWPVPGKMAQLQRVSELIESIDEADYSNTVIVVSDGTLLMPFMEVFAAEKDRFNITQGISMRETLVHRFVMSWIQLHASSIKRNNERLFYHKHLESFLGYPIVESWLAGAIQWSSLRKDVVSQNRKYLPLSEIREKTETDLFAQQAFHSLFEWNDGVSDIFERITQVLNQWTQSVQKLGVSRIETLAIKRYIEKLKLLLSQFSDVIETDDLRTLKTFIHRQVGYSRLHIEEPNNQAIQVMGMLETRMIDFKRVIVLGASDDQLPGNPPQITHIPFIHRLHHNLPTVKDSEALTAYHFYRLLQRAERVDLVYNTLTDEMSSGEPSRYIRQLKDDLALANQKIKIEEVGYDTVLQNEALKPLSIYKEDAVIQDVRAFLERRVSPSSLNKYVQSPLEFYFYYVLKLKEQEEVEEDIEATTFGSIVHDALEELYKPLIGKVLKYDDVAEKRLLIGETVERQFRKKFSQEDFETGRNFLAFTMAKSYVQMFIDFDLNELKSAPTTLLSMEDHMTYKLKVNDQEVHLYGKADRIDRRNGKTRIIDFKTGKTDDRDLKYIPEEMSSNQKLGKALQLAMYKYIYCRRENLNDDEVESMIYSFRSAAPRYQNLTVVSGDEPTNVVDSFQGVIAAFVDEMLDPTIPFEHREDSVYTTF